MTALIMLYSAIGLLYAIYFFIVGFRHLDSTAADTGLMVRLLWLPASFLLWPILLTVQRRGKASEKNT